MKKIAILMSVVLFLNACASKTKPNLESSTSSITKDTNKAPFLTEPKVRKVWVPEKIDGDKFIEGHYMWILEKTSSWSL